MRVLHINATQHGGAALCAIRINNALRIKGIESRMLFAEGESMPPDVDGSIANKDRCLWQSFPLLSRVVSLFRSHNPFAMNEMKLQRLVDKNNTNHLYLHTPLTKYRNLSDHPLVEWADIIHLHWVSGFIDYPTFFKRVNKPIVWTLHDKYPAVGLQHYSSEFYPVPKELKQLDDYCRRIKRDSLVNARSLNIVAISEMMVNICRNSEVLKGFPITLIHNGIDSDIFKIYDRQQSRKELGLIPNATIFLFSGYDIHDPNKGFIRVVEALETCKISNKILVCIGMSYLPMPVVSFPIILTGLQNSLSKIAKYYSAADFFLQSSFEETFSQTPLESMACGTPVVAFPFSGAIDLINEDNGILCEDFTIEALKKGINQASNCSYCRDKIREDVINRFSYDKIAWQYIELYKTVLESDETNYNNNQL